MICFSSDDRISEHRVSIVAAHGNFAAYVGGELAGEADTLQEAYDIAKHAYEGVLANAFRKQETNMNDSSFVHTAGVYAAGIKDGDLESWDLTVDVDVAGVRLTFMGARGSGDIIRVAPTGEISCHTIRDKQIKDLGTASDLKEAVLLLETNRAGADVT